MANQHRQGDVFLLRIDHIPTEAVQTVENNENILKLGEVTGHAHRLSGGQCQILKRGVETYVVVEKPTQLIHAEHNAQTIASGAYQLFDQVQYNPYTKAAERVQD